MMHFDALFGPGCGRTGGKGHHCWELDDDDGWWWWQLSRSISDKCTKKKSKTYLPKQYIQNASFGPWWWMWWNKMLGSWMMGGDDGS